MVDAPVPPELAPAEQAVHRLQGMRIPGQHLGNRLVIQQYLHDMFPQEAISPPGNDEENMSESHVYILHISRASKVLISVSENGTVTATVLR